MNTPVLNLAEEIFRRERARLPIKENLRILVEMQGRTNEVRRAVGRPEMFVWGITNP